MDQRPSTSRAAVMKNLEDLEINELEELLQKNREIQQEVKSTLQVLVTELNDAVAVKVKLTTT